MKKRLFPSATDVLKIGSALFVLSLIFFWESAHAEDENSASTQIPTPEQLTRGQELLDKVWKTATKISLSDSTEIFKEFRFSDLVSTRYPDHISVHPKHIINRDLQLLNGGISPEYIGTGLTFAWSLPWMIDPQEGLTAKFSAGINVREACIPINKVKERFGSNYVPVGSPPQIHPQNGPPKMHPFYGFRYTNVEGPDGVKGNVVFVFRYQNCVQQFLIYYAN